MQTTAIIFDQAQKKQHAPLLYGAAGDPGTGDSAAPDVALSAVAPGSAISNLDKLTDSEGAGTSPMASHAALYAAACSLKATIK